MAWWELFPKEWHAVHGGHSIRVRNSWTGGMQLYVDEVCVSRSDKLVAIDKKRPFLTCAIPAPDGGRDIVEVFVYATVAVKAKIVVNGQVVAGDRF